MAMELKHIAFIMDGNGRWAKKRGLSRSTGHREGVTALYRVIDGCISEKIPFLSVYAFSTENWKRPAPEVKFLMKLFTLFIEKSIGYFNANGIRFLARGNKDALPRPVRNSIEKAEAETAGNTVLTLIICLNYGGRDEIVRAVKRLNEKGTEISQENITREILPAGVTEVDLIVRTAGEKRLSGFLLWESSYAEFLFCDKLWPDMDSSDVKAAKESYYMRTRKFGGLDGK